MSLLRLVLPNLAWAELNEIISCLTLRELWVLGCCNRSAFITFLRERSLRKCKHYGSIPTRFLSKLSDHDKIALISYPRSGNSFMRQLVEQEFNIVTGSDNRPNRTLAAHLLEFGYQGEAITDSSVWMVKSHFPERLGYVRFPVQRMVLVIRNPFDSIESYFHMGMTNTHDKALSREAFISLKDTWIEFVRNEANTWVKFHEYWLKARTQLPILIVRYEDLVQDTEGVMKKTKAFMLEGKNPLCLGRFKPPPSVAAASAGYQPKKVKKFGKALDIMGDEEKATINAYCGDLMSIFGYKVISEPDPTSLDGTGSVIASLQVAPISDLSAPASAQNGAYTCDVRSNVFANLFPLCANAPAPSLTCASSVAPPAAPVAQNGSNSGVGAAPPGTLYINDYFTIRPESDKFGRGITEVRKGFTKGDKEPFPTA